MKCKNCGSSWESKQSFDKCPFCGVGIEKNSNTNSFSEVLGTIINEYGINILFDPRVIALLKDFAPKEQQKNELMGIFVSKGVGKIFVELYNEGKNQWETIRSHCIELLKEDAFLGEEFASLIIDDIGISLDINGIHKNDILVTSNESNSDITYNAYDTNMEMDLNNCLFYAEQDQRKFLLNGNGRIVKEYNNIDIVKRINNNLHIREGDKHGLMSIYGEEILPCKYSDIKDYKDDFAVVKMDKKWGGIDKKGKLIIPFMYDEISKINENIVSVELDGKWGYISTSGNIIASPMYESAREFSEGLAAVKIDSKWGYINLDGNIVISMKYNNVSEFSEGLANVAFTFNNKNSAGYITKEGLEKIPFIYDDSIPFSDFHQKKAVVRKQGMFGVVDINGNEITPFIYDFGVFGSRSNSIIALKRNDKWGFVDERGIELTQFMYDNLTNFSEGVAGVKKDGKWGYIDYQGKEIIECMYDGIRSCLNGACIVNKNKKYGIIDKKGSIIVPFEYSTIENIVDRAYSAY